MTALSPDDFRRFLAHLHLEQRAEVKAHEDEIKAVLVLHDRLLRHLHDVDVELLVPMSYEWGAPGATGSLYGIPLRIVPGIEQLYLAHKVKP